MDVRDAQEVEASNSCQLAAGTPCNAGNAMRQLFACAQQTSMHIPYLQCRQTLSVGDDALLSLEVPSAHRCC